MPTGYTAPIYEGKDITFREFAMRCARGINYLSMMRDHGLDAELPEKLMPSDHHEERIERAKAEIERIQAMTSADADHAAAWEYEQARRRMSDGLHEMNARRNRLQAMLVKADAWTPPTPAHEVLKEFMLDQLHGELRRCMSFSWPEPVRQSGVAWREERLADARDDLRRAEERLEEDRRWCDTANAWLAALRESLPSDYTK